MLKQKAKFMRVLVLKRRPAERSASRCGGGAKEPAKSAVSGSIKFGIRGLYGPTPNRAKA